MMLLLVVVALAARLGVSATRLLVLGVVRGSGHMHGYRVGADLLSWGAGEWANVKWGSIYRALRAPRKLPRGSVNCPTEAPVGHTAGTAGEVARRQATTGGRTAGCARGGRRGWRPGWSGAGAVGCRSDPRSPGTSGMWTGAGISIRVLSMSSVIVGLMLRIGRVIQGQRWMNSGRKTCVGNSDIGPDMGICGWIMIDMCTVGNESACG